MQPYKPIISTFIDKGEEYIDISFCDEEGNPWGSQCLVSEYKSLKEARKDMLKIVNESIEYIKRGELKVT
ncbi:hypothetical protein LCGC14_2850930 [marine sediment metagenome]|uniref:Uncharacterized protein n=1 Tax=marine sediment metagenome TaxID=412755 RepID=A0A0F8Y8E2_9ZZZZ